MAGRGHRQQIFILLLLLWHLSGTKKIHFYNKRHLVHLSFFVVFIESEYDEHPTHLEQIQNFKKVLDDLSDTALMTNKDAFLR